MTGEGKFPELVAVKEMVMPGMGLLFWSNAVTVIVDPDNPVVCTTGLGLGSRVIELKTGVEGFVNITILRIPPMSAPLIRPWTSIVTLLVRLFSLKLDGTITVNVMGNVAPDGTWSVLSTSWIVRLTINIEG